VPDVDAAPVLTLTDPVPPAVDRAVEIATLPEIPTVLVPDDSVKDPPTSFVLLPAIIETDAPTPPSLSPGWMYNAPATPLLAIPEAIYTSPDEPVPVLAPDAIVTLPELIDPEDDAD